MRLLHSHGHVRLFFVAVPGFFLHSLHLFFFNSIHTVQQLQCNHILIRHGFQDLFHPRIVLSAHIDEHVAVLYGDDILRRGFVGMSLFSGLQEHRQIHIISCDLTNKIILWENRCHHADPSVIRRIFRSVSSAARKQAPRHENASGQQHGTVREIPLLILRLDLFFITVPLLSAFILCKCELKVKACLLLPFLRHHPFVHFIQIREERIRLECLVNLRHIDRTAVWKQHAVNTFAADHIDIVRIILFQFFQQLFLRMYNNRVFYMIAFVPVRTMLVLFFKGIPLGKLSRVLRPITTTFPVVVCLKNFISDGMLTRSLF